MNEPEPFTIDTAILDGWAIVCMAGELDMHAEDAVRALIPLAKSHSVAVDAFGITFIDARGVALLAEVQTACRETGRAFRLERPSPAVQRLMDLLGDAPAVNRLRTTS